MKSCVGWIAPTCVLSCFGWCGICPASCQKQRWRWERRGILLIPVRAEPLECWELSRAFTEPTDTEASWLPSLVEPLGITFWFEAQWFEENSTLKMTKLIKCTGACLADSCRSEVLLTVYLTHDSALRCALNYLQRASGVTLAAGIPSGFLW